MQKDFFMFSSSRPSLYRTHFNILIRLSAAAAAIAALVFSDASSFAGRGLSLEGSNGITQIIDIVFAPTN